MVHRLGVLRELPFGKDFNGSIGVLGAQVPHPVRQIVPPFARLRGVNVVGLDRYVVCVFKCQQGLSPSHSRLVGIDGPCNPALGFSRWGHKGHGQCGSGGIVGPV